MACRPDGALKAEKELTRRGDELVKRRQELPWVRIDKAYRFDTDQGNASLAISFADARKSSSTTSCSVPTTPPVVRPARRSQMASTASPHLANHDVMLWAVSRAPLAKLLAYKRRMGWTFPWASSFGSDFNSDFCVGFTEEQQRSGGIEYNYRREGLAAARG